MAYTIWGPMRNSLCLFWKIYAALGEQMRYSRMDRFLQTSFSYIQEDE